MFSRLALDLYDQGYRRLLPLVPGEKRPRYSNWQIYNSRDARLDEIERWSRVCRDDGIGLAAGPVGAVDLDHKDGEIAFAVREMADQIIGETPLVRIGEPHKGLRLYRTTAGLTTKTLQDLQIGVYATTGQVVLYGIHPRTGRPYERPEAGPLEVHADDIPLLTPYALDKFLAKLRAADIIDPKPAPVASRRSLVAIDEGPTAYFHRLRESDPDVRFEDAVADYTRNATARHPAMVRCVAVLQQAGVSEAAILDVIGDAYMQHFVRDGSREILRRYKKLIEAIRGGERKGLHLDLDDLRQRSGQAKWGRLSDA